MNIYTTKIVLASLIFSFFAFVLAAFALYTVKYAAKESREAELLAVPAVEVVPVNGVEAKPSLGVVDDVRHSVGNQEDAVDKSMPKSWKQQLQDTIEAEEYFFTDNNDEIYFRIVADTGRYVYLCTGRAYTESGCRVLSFDRITELVKDFEVRIDSGDMPLLSLSENFMALINPSEVFVISLYGNRMQLVYSAGPGYELGLWSSLPSFYGQGTWLDDHTLEVSIFPEHSNGDTGSWLGDDGLVHDMVPASPVDSIVLDMYEIM